MIVTAYLIVLHTTKYGDSSIILHTLSREYGRRSFILKGVGGRKTSLSLVQPLSIVEAEIIVSRHSQLYQIKKLVAKYQLTGIRTDIYKNAITMFLSEVLFKTVREGCYEDGLYEAVERNILLLDSVHSEFSNFHIHFLLELVIRLGFNPQGEDIQIMAQEYYPVISKFMNSDFAEAMLIPLSGENRKNIAETILRYIEYHIDYQLNINSLNVLHELLN